MNKIFQIGFNRCGTSSLYHLFHRGCSQRTNSIHWDKGNIARRIEDNYNNNKLLLSEIEQYGAYFDVECMFPRENKHPIYPFITYYKILDQQYPNSKFILNTRKMENWLKSRSNFIFKYNARNVVSYMDTCCKAYKMTPLEVTNKWSNDWISHHLSVVNYFSDRPDDLLIYDMEADNKAAEFNKLKEFFGELTFFLNSLPIENEQESALRRVSSIMNSKWFEQVYNRTEAILKNKNQKVMLNSTVKV